MPAGNKVLPSCEASPHPSAAQDVVLNLNDKLEHYNQPQSKLMNSSVTTVLLYILFIILNLLPTYLWLWGVSLIDLERPEFSYVSVNTRDTLNSILRFVLIVGLWLPLFVVLLKRPWKLKALAIPSSISLILFLIMVKSQDVYPDEESEYTENGYQHRIEKWNKKNQIRIKHWKSRDSLKNQDSYRHIEWELVKEETKN